jgi:SAM-dependent methyltransferase
MHYHQVTQTLRDAYNTSADARDGSPLASWKLEERQRVLRFFRAAGTTRLLEIGGGAGKDSKFFLDQGFDVVCTDLSPEMVRCCQTKGLTAYVMDFLNLDFPLASFDAVYALNCLLHVPKRDLPAVLQRVQSLLKPGGVFYLGLYGGREFEGLAPDDWHEPKRFFSYHTDEQILQAVARFLELVDFKRVTVDPNDEFHFQSLILRRA